ncbi:MAG: hypothetical protein Kow00120_05150 [Anaerolineae bacterium]
MNILGIGAAELVIIFLILLVVAGPKRMVAWAYIAGRELSKLRAMWSETMEMIQSELEEAGVEEVKELRNLGKLRNFDLNKEVRKALEEPLAEGEKKKPAPKPRTKPTASEAEKALSAAVVAASPDAARPAAPHPEARALDADAPSGEAGKADAGSDSGNGVADATDGGPASEPAPEPEPEPEDESETPA